MEEISLSGFFAYIKQKLLLIILVFVIVLTAGIMYSLMFKTPSYKSTSTIVLVSEGENSLQTDITLNQKLVTTYKEIAQSRSVLERVINELNLKYSYEDLLSKLSITSVTSTEILKISVIDNDPVQAKVLAEKITNIFAEEVLELYKIENTKVLDEASTPNDPYNINLLKDIILYLGIATFVNGLIILVGFTTDNALKTVEQVEVITNLPIIGIIPTIDKRRALNE